VAVEAVGDRFVAIFNDKRAAADDGVEEDEEADDDGDGGGSDKEPEEGGGEGEGLIAKSVDDDACIRRNDSDNVRPAEDEVSVVAATDSS
jgi:hypothetical protein